MLTYLVYFVQEALVDQHAIAIPNNLTGSGCVMIGCIITIYLYFA